MKLIQLVAAGSLLTRLLAFPSPFEPVENMEKIREAQAELDSHSSVFMRYDLAGLMEMWRHPGEHDCEEWAPAVTMEPDFIKYTWCGNSFCADIYSSDGLLIDKIDVQVY